ncbi:hypothetical protein AMK26_22215 [Streptomyces sp. CB03234]|uniref:hypothetical protein n=1 Tax=Streptomyces sp. (strain CB03234) TaxID=1703937 RepID=UPI00095D3393|nr:hypothetical protein [Streptomyces sp. CB03234]OKK02385.1 hypothetical protein AMK26_22215 [Streptomyces sp. CB03234]
MTTRTPGDRHRRRNLADASVTPLPALAGLLRRVPGQRRRTGAFSSIDDPDARHDRTSQIGTER